MLNFHKIYFLLFFSRSASDYSQEFTCSVVLGDDLVPRLGLCNVEKLKMEVASAVNSCDLAKVSYLYNYALVEKKNSFLVVEYLNAE